MVAARVVATAIFCGLVAAVMPLAAETQSEKAVKQARETLAAARNTGSQVEITHVGVPSENLIALLADEFDLREATWRAGVSVEDVAIAYCGHANEQYMSHLLKANAESFQNRKVTSRREKTALKMPACLMAPTLKVHYVKMGDTPKSLAKLYYDLPVASLEFCRRLEALNGKDICGQARSLQIDDKITYDQLGIGTIDEGRLAFAPFIRSLPLKPALKPSDVAAALYTNRNPDGLTVKTNAGATLIVPSQADTCSRSSKAPFDVNLVVQAYLRLAHPGSREARAGKTAIERLRAATGPARVPPVVGVIDTGLYAEAFASLAKQVGRSMPHPISRTISQSEDGRNIEPTNGDTYADHGTHVSGLILGGANWWSVLEKAKGTTALYDPNASSYLWSVMPDVVFVKVSSLATPPDVPTISIEAVESALAFLKEHVEILNFSLKAPHTAGLQKMLNDFADSRFVISAAGNQHDELEALYSGQNPVLSAMLTSDKQSFFITVGAADQNLAARAPFSNWSKRTVDLLAPGTCIESFVGASPQGASQQPVTAFYSGTSQATPLVTFAVSMLRAVGVERKEVKLRILSTVDHLPEAKGSLSEGVLNIAKSLDFLHDIIVRKSPSTDTYERGELEFDNGDGSWGDHGRICAVPADSEPTTVEKVLAREARRIVIVDGSAKIVRLATRSFYYEACTPNPNLSIRFKGKKEPPFKLAELKEIIPRAAWSFGN